MRAIETLKQEATLAYSQLETTLADVSEPLSWAKVPLPEGAFLNTNGTIVGIVQHLAVCKFMYGSTAFQSKEIRWRNCFDQLEAIGTSWEGSKAYLAQAQRYWMASWQELRDGDLKSEREHFSGKTWPTWKIIATVNQHDVYHHGQISLLSSILTPCSTPPDMAFEEERGYVKDLPGW